MFAAQVAPPSWPFLLLRGPVQPLSNLRQAGEMGKKKNKKKQPTLSPKNLSSPRLLLPP